MKENFLKRTGRLALSLAVLVWICISVSLPVKAKEYAGNETTAQKVKLVVVDETDGNALHGAEFALQEKKNGSYEVLEGLEHITVSADGADLGALAFGEYRLIQLTAPNGYIITSKAAEFSVTTEGVVLTNDADNVQLAQKEDTCVLTVSNMVGFIVRLPSTGGSGDMPYVLAGILLMAAAIMCGMLLRHKRTTGLLAWAAICVMTALMPVSIQAAELSEEQLYTEAPVYTYYVIMKASDGSKGEAYYVEEEALANALLNLNLRGERVCYVTKVLGTDYWIVSLNEEAEFTQEELASVFADLKEWAVVSGTVQKNVIELEENGLIYIESDRGEQFVLTGELPEVVNNKNPVVSIAEDDVSYAEIGGTVTCTATTTIPSQEEYVVTTTLSKGLTMGGTLKVLQGDTELPAESNPWIKWTEASAGSEETKYTITIPSDITVAGFTFKVTFDVIVNTYAQAENAEQVEVEVKYNDSNLGKAEKKLYTFGFELDTVDGEDNALADMGFMLTRTGETEETYYYTLFEETAAAEEAAQNDVPARFQTAECVVTTNEEGKIAFSGLSAGTYKLTQTAAVVGYKVLENPITVTINDKGKISIEGAGEASNDTQVGTEGNCYGKVILKYTDGVEIPEIPSTGGLGTGFYRVAGVLLILAAGTVLAVRKKQGFNV